MGLNESLVSFPLPSSSVSLSFSADLSHESIFGGLPSFGLDNLPSPYGLALDSTVQYTPEFGHQGLTVPEQGLEVSDCPAFCGVGEGIGSGGDGSPLEDFGLFIDEEGRGDYQTEGTEQEDSNFSPADLSCLMFSPSAGMELGAINSPLEDHLGCREGPSETSTNYNFRSSEQPVIPSTIPSPGTSTSHSNCRSTFHTPPSQNLNVMSTTAPTTSAASLSALASATGSTSTTTAVDATAGEDLEVARKRYRNTLAARKYRQKRLDRIKELEMSLKAVSKERDELRLRLVRQEAETATLKEMLRMKGGAADGG